MVSAEHAESMVRRYLERVASGSADEIAELYADDATVEDPVGVGEVHIGRHAITGFYRNIENMARETELLALRVCGHEAAFMFRITVGADEGSRMRIEPIDVMTFDGEGKIASMKAYWSAANVATV
ncbi:MAG: nuclear transport factor 2 family protein [Actinomycetia bacterium]|nr:nuclear transport factor 2 family protein [Actinomycetes bacterium]